MKTFHFKTQLLSVLLSVSLHAGTGAWLIYGYQPPEAVDWFRVQPIQVTLVNDIQEYVGNTLEAAESNQIGTSTSISSDFEVSSSQSASDIVDPVSLSADDSQKIERIEGPNSDHSKELASTHTELSNVSISETVPSAEFVQTVEPNETQQIAPDSKFEQEQPNFLDSSDPLESSIQIIAAVQTKEFHNSEVFEETVAPTAETFNQLTERNERSEILMTASNGEGNPVSADSAAVEPVRDEISESSSTFNSVPFEPSGLNWNTQTVKFVDDLQTMEEPHPSKELKSEIVLSATEENSANPVVEMPEFTKSAILTEQPPKPVDTNLKEPTEYQTASVNRSRHTDLFSTESMSDIVESEIVDFDQQAALAAIPAQQKTSMEISDVDQKPEIKIDEKSNDYTETDIENFYEFAQLPYRTEYAAVDLDEVNNDSTVSLMAESAQNNIAQQDNLQNFTQHKPSFAASKFVDFDQLRTAYNEPEVVDLELPARYSVDQPLANPETLEETEQVGPVKIASVNEFSRQSDFLHMVDFEQMRLIWNTPEIEETDNLESVQSSNLLDNLNSQGASAVAQSVNETFVDETIEAVDTTEPTEKAAKPLDPMINENSNLQLSSAEPVNQRKFADFTEGVSSEQTKKNEPHSQATQNLPSNDLDFEPLTQQTENQNLAQAMEHDRNMQQATQYEDRRFDSVDANIEPTLTSHNHTDKFTDEKIDQIEKLAMISSNSTAMTTSPKYGVEGLANPPPQYPYFSRVKGEEGQVLLKVLVDDTGQVIQTTTLTSSGYSRLDEAAIKAVKKWQFIPAQTRGNATTASVEIPFSFVLTN